MASERATALDPNSSKRRRGIYTQTVIPSPVVRWILHARIRDENHNDVIFVGDHSVRVEQLEEGGYLQHIATKNDFDAQILAATTIRTSPELSIDESIAKRETDENGTQCSVCPSHMIVLTLDTKEVMFLFLEQIEGEVYKFRSSTCRLPPWTQPVLQLGQHLSVDPSSRAVAVASMEQKVWVGLRKDPHDLKTDVNTYITGWSLIRAERTFEVEGVIQNMSFLEPLAGDNDRVILLFIVIQSGRTKAVWIDWYHSQGFKDGLEHPTQTLDMVSGTSSLLIPLKETSFLLVRGKEITQWKNLLSGSATAYTSPVDIAEPKYPGLSPAEPMWANWTKPCRNQTARRERTDVYLAREDGLVFLLSIDSGTSIDMSFAGDLDCHVGSAFAALGDEFDPDILAVGGDSSSGRIVTIGAMRGIENLNWREAMSMNVTQWLPNWTASMDMIPSDLGVTKPLRFGHGHGVYITAGREPHGSITELRRGVEVRILAYFDLDSLKSVTDVWTLLDSSSGYALMVLSRPTSTQLLHVSSDITEVEQVAEPTIFETSQRTLVAGITTQNHFVQVTPHNICIAKSLEAGIDDVIHLPEAEGDEILLATLTSDPDALVFAEKSSKGFVLICMPLDPQLPRDTQREAGVHIPIDTEPLCISAICAGTGIIVATATADDRIGLVRMTDDAPIWHFTRIPRATTDEISLCDHIVVVRTSSSSTTPDIRILCGLRDGRIMTYKVDFAQDCPFQNPHTFKFSNAPVKILGSSATHDFAFAVSGNDYCILQCAGGTLDWTTVENIWASDKSRPDLLQGPVFTSGVVLPADPMSTSALANSLVMVCEDEILVGSLEHTTTTISRQIPVNGSPNRLTYSEELRSLVCASECSGIRPAASPKPHASTRTKRQRWPVIDFIPIRQIAPSFTHELQPGERVRALLSWSYRSKEEKTYSYILVGGSYIRPQGHRRGRVSLLQPQVRNREVVGLYNEPHNIKFASEVSALGRYDAVSFIACAGDYVYIYRFSVEAKKWNQFCSPHQLPSPGICISTQDIEGQILITISTTRDSIIVLEARTVEPETQSAFPCELIRVTSGSEAILSLSHLTLPSDSLPSSSSRSSSNALTLVSSKDGCLYGIEHPHPLPPPKTSHTANASWQPSKTVFDATTLAGSLRRIWPCAPVVRKGTPPPGVVDRRLIASRTDGAIMGLAILEPEIWRRLSWLQRLCEWSPVLSPHSSYRSPYAWNLDREVELPIGLAAAAAVEGSWIVLPTRRQRKIEDLHVDGDILARILRRNGAEEVKRVLHLLAEEEERDAVCEWVRNHLEEELEAVDEVVDLVRRLNKWM